MFGKSVTLFRMFGFSVRIDVSWLVILALVVWSLAGGVFPQRYPGMSGWTYFLMGLAAALGLFASIVVHEFCHSLVARQYGIPMRGITLFLFGGVAEMADEPASPKAEFLMAAAGPAASVVVAGVFLTLAAVGRLAGWSDVAVGIVQWIGFINALLVAFNLIPGFPLDGGRILRSALWAWKHDLRKATQTASRVGAAFGAVLIGLGFLNLLWLNPIGGLWWILIGLFLRAAARQGYQQVVIRQMLHGEPVRQFMHDQPITVSRSLPIEDLVNNYVYHHHHKMFPVVEDGRLLGCVTTQQIKNVPRGMWPDQTVDDVMVPCGDENTIASDADTMDALRTMTRTHSSRLMVVDDSRLIGVVSLKDLLKFLDLKLELESGESEPLPSQSLPALPK